MDERLVGQASICLPHCAQAPILYPSATPQPASLCVWLSLLCILYLCICVLVFVHFVIHTATAPPSQCMCVAISIYLRKAVWESTHSTQYTFKHSNIHENGNTHNTSNSTTRKTQNMVVGMNFAHRT